MVQADLPLTVGDIAPPFTLRTSAGEDVRLVEVLNSKTAIVVFIRGTW